MKRFQVLLVLLLALGLTAPALGVDFAFHGDLNNRFQIYTDQNDFFRAEQQGITRKKNVEDNFGEIKYRFWTEAASDDGKVKGVYAIEIGGLRYGEAGKGAEFSGDGVNVETRWAYLDFQLPGIESKNRLQMGLNSQNINKYFWAETVMGVKNYGSPTDMVDYTVAWFRPIETNASTSNQSGQDLDGFYGRANFKAADNLLVGVFGLWFYKDDPQGSDAIEDRKYEIKQFARNAEFNQYTLGIDGNYKTDVGPGNLFLNYDLLYQGGKIKNASFTTTAPGDQTGATAGGRASADFDVKAYFLHLDAGYKWEKSTFTYTFWYASGDDDPNDKDFKGFLAVDVDSFDNHILFESYTDDDVFTERNYLLDKGFVMNKLRFDYQFTDKVKAGLSGMYMLTAEDIEYFDKNGVKRKNDKIGFELDADVRYQIYKGLEFNTGAGFLWADDAMDFFEQNSQVDGKSDNNIFRWVANIRYKF